VSLANSRKESRSGGGLCENSLPCRWGWQWLHLRADAAQHMMAKSAARDVPGAGEVEEGGTCREDVTAVGAEGTRGGRVAGG
jgi:hypothetical protein